MNDIKYLGVQGLEELIILAQNGLAKKADVLQFDVMPDPIKYIGKVVQYVGVSNVSFTRSHFYYSNGIKWTEETISDEQTTQIEMVTVLPAWVNADPQTLYILKDIIDKKMGLYVKNPSVNDSWFTVESSGSFAVVDTLPQWADADSSTIYFKADGNILTGYIKKTGTIGAWYTLGGDLTLDAVPTDGSQHSVMSGGVYDALLTKENVANKVTTIDAASTDEQYPSAKAVHDAIKGLEPIPEGFIQNVDTGMQPVEDGKVMRISKTAFDALAQRDPNVMYYLDEEHDLIDAKPTCRDTDGNLVKGQKIVELTKEQYDNLAVKDPDTYYMINNDNSTKAWHPRPDWANIVTITEEQIYAGYIAPSDGMFICVAAMSDKNSDANRVISINGIIIVIGRRQPSDGSNPCGFDSTSCPVSEGDIIKAKADNAWVNEKRYFVPWKA